MLLESRSRLFRLTEVVQAPAVEVIRGVEPRAELGRFGEVRSGQGVALLPMVGQPKQKLGLAGLGVLLEVIGHPVPSEVELVLRNESEDRGQIGVQGRPGSGRRGAVRRRAILTIRRRLSTGRLRSLALTGVALIPTAGRHEQKHDGQGPQVQV